jgi:hypothetical protein
LVAKVREELAARDILEHQVYSVRVLELADQVDNEWVLHF